MKGRLIFKERKDACGFNYDLSLSYLSFCDYEISICTDLSENFLDLLSDCGDLDRSISLGLEMCQNDEDIHILERCRKNKLDILRNAEYVTFYFDIERVAMYVKNNAVLRNKKIVFEDALKMDSDTIEKIGQLFDDKTNLYFMLEGNSNLIGYDEFVRTMKVLNGIVDEIKLLDLSVLETIMYVFDLVRDRVYKEVSEGEDKMISRDLSSSLLGDKIVCMGYATIFKTLLNKLGIETRECIVMNDKVGHARNEIYVKDDKYGIDGVYYFDPTWGSKDRDDDVSYLLSYRFFAMTRVDVDLLDKGKMVDSCFPYFSLNMDIKFLNFYQNEDYYQIPPEMVKSINYMSNLINGESLLYRPMPIKLRFFEKNSSKEVISEKISSLIGYFDRPLSAEILLTLLYNVRKKQYYLNPDKYQFSIDDFYRIAFLSGWYFDDGYVRLIRTIYGIRNFKINREQYNNYIEDSNLDTKIEQVRLVRTLRKVYDQKKHS